MHAGLRGAAAVFLALAIGCGLGPGSEQDPRPHRVTPQRGLNTAPVQVTIEGENFVPLAVQNVGGGPSVELKKDFQAWLGETPLEQLDYRDTGRIDAVVPAGVPEGWLDLTIESPLGRKATLAKAYFAYSRGFAHLAGTASAEPARVGIGQPITVELALLNDGEGDVLGVSGQLSTSGTAQVEVASAPNPVDVVATARIVLAWSVVPRSAGAVVFQVSGLGTDRPTGTMVGVGPLPTGAVIVEAPADLDGGLDGGSDAGLDASLDAGLDASLDAGLDAALFAGLDAAPAAGLDAGPIAGLDAAPAAGQDAAPVAGQDAAPIAGQDAAAPVGDDAGPVAGLDAAPVSGQDAAPVAGLDAALPAGQDASQPDAAVICADGEVRCLATMEEICVSGSWSLKRACPAGCNVAQKRCFQPVLSGIDQTWLDAAVSKFDPLANVTLDTDLGTINGVPLGADFHVIAGQVCGAATVETGAFVFKTVHVGAGLTVRVRGTRAAAIVSAGDVLIEGLIDVTGGKGACPAANLRCAGPGAGAGGRSSNPGDSGSGPGGGTGGPGTAVGLGDELGGGGGSHRGIGGRGGNDTVHLALKGGVGGPTYVSTNPACGGSGGGGGGAGSGWTYGHDGSAGGGGGGALLLGSLTQVVVQGTGAINAGGGGGQGDELASYDDGGGGGGSGGTITLEAPAIDLLSGVTLAANGGGGGGGFKGGQPPDDGTTGLLSASRALGGAGGGAGGAGATLDGLNATDMDDGTGGGGGGAGQIVLRSVGGPGTAGATISPPEQDLSLPVQ